MPDDRNGSYSQAIDKTTANDPQLLMLVLPNNNEEKYILHCFPLSNELYLCLCFPSLLFQIFLYKKEVLRRQTSALAGSHSPNYRPTR